jgi:hypothetical protein
LDKVQERRTIGVETSANNGKMSALQEELSAIVPAPYSGHAGHSASSSGIQTRRHRAAAESTSTNEGGEALERRKKRQR